MIKLTKKQKTELDSFVQMCCKKFGKEFSLDENLSNIIEKEMYSPSLMVLKDDSQTCFSVIYVSKEIEILSNLISIPADFKNISLDRKLRMIFISLPETYLLIGLSGMLLLRTNDLEDPNTMDFLNFYEEVAFMEMHHFC